MENKRNAVFLDDFRNPQNSYNYTGNEVYIKRDWIVVRDYNDFTRFMTLAADRQETWPELISFDHDLSEEHYAPEEMWSGTHEAYHEWLAAQGEIAPTGYDCAKWLVDLCMDRGLKLPEYLCHSQNPAGKLNILTYLDNYRKHEQRQ